MSRFKEIADEWEVLRIEEQFLVDSIKPFINEYIDEYGFGNDLVYAITTNSVTSVDITNECVKYYVDFSTLTWYPEFDECLWIYIPFEVYDMNRDEQKEYIRGIIKQGMNSTILAWISNTNSDELDHEVVKNVMETIQKLPEREQKEVLYLLDEEVGEEQYDPYLDDTYNY